MSKLETINTRLETLRELERIVEQCRAKHGYEMREELLDSIGRQILDCEWKRKQALKPVSRSSGLDIL